MTKLTLYHSPSCCYCDRVQRAVAELGIDVEMVNVGQRPEGRAELVKATGRATVPVLRIDEGEQVRWMPESRDIVDYLYQRAGRGARSWTQRAGRLLALVAVVGGLALLTMLTRCGGT